MVKKRANNLYSILSVIFIGILTAAPLAADDEESQKPLYPTDSSGGRPGTVRMMVGEDGKAGEKEIGFTESQIKDAVEVNKKGEVVGGKYEELKKMAEDLLTNQVPGELPTPIGKAKTPIPHAYDRGTTSEEVSKNQAYDTETILNNETFPDCMDYKVIDPEGCLKIMPLGEIVFTPFVKYHGPPQKVENVDQPLKTGYLTKEEVDKILSGYTVDDYYRYAAQIADYNIRYVTAMVSFQKCMLEIKHLKLTTEEARAKCTLSVKPHKFGDAESYSKRFVDDMKSGVIDNKFIYRNMDSPENGYIFNEYHLMPTGIDLRYGRAFLQAFLEPNVFEAFMLLIKLHIRPDLIKYTPLYDTYVHYGPESGKIPKAIFADFPSAMLISRHTGISVGLFPDWMLEKSYDPKMCASWDRNEEDQYEDLLKAKENVDDKGLQHMKQLSADRRISFDQDTSKNTADGKESTNALRGTPNDMLLGYVDSGDFNPYADKLCQGMNQGHWLPLTNRVNTNFHTVAASIGTVRAIQAGGYIYPFSNYKYSHFRDHGRDKPNNQDDAVTKDHDGDKVQWLRNAYMDRDPNASGGDSEEKGKKACHSIDRWVKKFGEANIKHYTDKPGDNTLPSKLEEFTGGHWYVAAHWRYWRGCLNPFVEGTTPIPITAETMRLKEYKD